MGLFDWLTSASPGGQIGEAAKSAITGVFDGVTKIIDEFHVSAEEKVQLKIAVAEQKLKAVELMVNDVQNARAMQIQTKSVWPGMISMVIIVGFFGGGGYVLMNGIPSDMSAEGKQIINMYSVALISGLSSVIGYWLGSSMGSQQKDTLIYQSTPVKKDGP
jgi:MFS family permease